MTDPSRYELILMRWAEQAACRGLDPELFFPPKGGPASEATAVCEHCPVIDECLRYALETRQTKGIWGGHTPTQRRPLQPVGKRPKLPPPHGTETRYRHHHCHCPNCIEAHRTAVRERRRR